MVCLHHHSLPRWFHLLGSPSLSLCDPELAIIALLQKFITRFPRSCSCIHSSLQSLCTHCQISAQILASAVAFPQTIISNCNIPWCLWCSLNPSFSFLHLFLIYYRSWGKFSHIPDKNVRASNLGVKLLQKGLNGSSVKKRKTALNCMTGCWYGWLHCQENLGQVQLEHPCCTTPDMRNLVYLVTSLFIVMTFGKHLQNDITLISK